MRKLLVVDESKTIRTIAQWLLKGSQDKVETVADTKAADTSINNEKPNLILLSYNFGGVMPIDWVKSLKSKPETAAIPIVMLTGKYAPFDMQKAKNAGIAEFLEKPFNSTDFFNVTYDLLDNPPPVEIIPSPQNTAQPNTSARENSSDLISSIPQSSPKRFDFPISGVSSQPNIKPIKKPASSLSPTPSKQLRPVSAPLQPTPKTPLPSISPDLSTGTPNIDPQQLKTEVQLAVRDILPGIVKSILKKLIVSEVTPQIQHWVDSRVETLVKEYMQEKK